jgi:hypothetical protein
MARKKKSPAVLKDHTMKKQMQVNANILANTKYNREEVIVEDRRAKPSRTLEELRNVK